MQNVQETEPAWSPEDSKMASGQGWDIFEVDRDPEGEKELVNGKPYGHRPWELQRDDEAEAFANDGAAHAFVRAAAQNGDPLAVRALSFLQAHSPIEYDSIMAQTESLPS